MATGGEETVGYSLANVMTLKLEQTSDKFPFYISIVVCQDKIFVLDDNTYKVYIHRLHDGKLMAMSDRLESRPRDMCLMDAMTICVLHDDGLIKMMSIDSTDMSCVITTTKKLRLQGVLDWYHGVVRFKDNLVVTGKKQGMMFWCVVSFDDGHVDIIQQVCKGSLSRVTTKDNIIYILCRAGDLCPDTGVYGFDILNPSQYKYTYKHQRLQFPTSIVIIDDVNIFVCNGLNDSCIHQLTASCQLVSIYTQGIPLWLYAIFWDNGRLYGTCYESSDITVFQRVYQGGHKASNVLVSDERKQPAIKETAIQIGQENVPFYKYQTDIKYTLKIHSVLTSVLDDDINLKMGDAFNNCYHVYQYLEVDEEIKAALKYFIKLEKVDKWQTNVVTEMPPSAPVPEDSEDDKQGPVIPMEILRMDDKSLQLYKEALRDGKEKVYNIRVMVVGQFGVGKTTLTKRLLGQQVDISERKSTEGIDVHKHCCKIALDTGEWIVQHEASDEIFRLQRLVKLLTCQSERPEDSSEQKGDTEVIYQRETTPDELHGPVHYSDDDEDASADRKVIFINDLSDSSESDIYKEVEANSITIQKSGTTDKEADITKKQPERSPSVNADQRPPALEMRGIIVQESKSLVTSKDEAMMEFLQLVNEKADKLEKSLVEYAALAMWDFAGQYVFYTTHQTFLTCRAIYLLVTDLSKQVTDLVEDDECFFDTEGVKLCKVQDLVEVWMNSVHCCAPSSIANTPVTSPAAAITMTSPTLTSHGASTSATSTDVSNAVIPPVILVGTHVDKIRQDKRQEIIRKYFDQICFILNDKPAFQHLEDFFPIDNTQFDPQLEKLRKRIFELASKQPYWGQEVPANWLPLEASLMNLKASGIKVILRSLVEEMNQAGVVPIKNTEQLDLFLRFQHETGNFIYFGTEGLREWLVLDPAWLIDALKSLITADTFIFKNNPAIRSKLFEFRDKGKLTAELIDAIWTKEKHPEFHYYKEIILQLMEKLNIVARPRLYSPDAEEVKVEGYFLAPCMLRQATPKELLSFGPNSQQGNASVICFVFTGKFLPSPVFHRLLAACMAQWPIARKKMENLIFCGCCLFDLDLLHRLTVLFREHVIFAGVTRIGTTEKTPSSKLCIEVRDFITRTLSSIIGCLGQSLQFELSIQCPNTDKYSVHCHIPVAILQGNVEVPCHFHDNSHVIMSHDVLKFWFQEELQQAIEQRVLSASEEYQEDEGHDDPPISQEHINHARLCNALTTVCADALREILVNQVPVPYANIYQVILANETNLSRKLSNDQCDVVFPDTPGTTGTVDQFDISLLYTIIRNISSVPVPTTGWGNPPLDQPRDTSLGASVERIRFHRNAVSGHSVDGKIGEAEFKDYWQKIDHVLGDIESVIGVRGYRVQLEKRKNQVITPHEAHQLQSQFQEYQKQVEDAKEKLRIAMEAVQKLLP